MKSFDINKYLYTYNEWLMLDRTPMVTMLLDAGADVNTVNKKTGEVILFSALRTQIGGRWNPKIIRLLVTRGANLNYVDRSGRGVLQLTFEQGDGIFEFLLEHGAPRLPIENHNVTLVGRDLRTKKLYNAEQVKRLENYGIVVYN